jgi:MFS family permease
MSAGHDAAAVPAPIAEGRGDAAFAALRRPAFRSYFATATVAMMADNVEHVISYWVIFGAFRSPALAGFAVISHWVPHLFFGIFIGALADRYDSRKLMQGAQLTFMVVSVAWAALFVTGTLQAWHAVVLLTAHGFASAFFNPASQLIVHDMAGAHDLQSAIRLNAMGRNVAILFGPAVGGALLLVLGPAMGLVANVLIYAPFSV